MLVVRNALRQRRLEAENRALREQVERRFVMVGESSAMRPAARADRHGRADERARADLGENGTGKELVARSIHALSRRRTGRSSRSTARRFPRS